MLKKTLLTCFHDNPKHFWRFYQKLLIAVIKGFLNATSSYVNGFPRAAEANSILGIFNTVCSGFLKPIFDKKNQKWQHIKYRFEEIAVQ
jgi:hypothetical protein